MSVLIVLGFASWLGFGITPHPIVDKIPPAAQSLTIFLILKAFASGCAALTGVEAISDGVPAFKEPQDQNAAKTLVAMGLILGSLFLGITFLARHYHLAPVADQNFGFAARARDRRNITLLLFHSSGNGRHSPAGG